MQVLLREVVVVLKNAQLVVVLALMGTGCGRRFGPDPYPPIEPEWPREPVRIELNGLVDCERDFPDVEFSVDGSMLCVWWHPRTGDYSKDPVAYVLFDTEGQLRERSEQVATSTNSLLRAFPSVWWRVLHRDFVAGASAWCFTADLAQGARVVGGRRVAPVLELWRFAPRATQLWQRALPSQYIRTSPLLAFAPTATNGVADVLVDLDGQEALVLSGSTGDELGRFTYGHIESDEEAARRAKRFGVRSLSRDPAMKFSVMSFAIDAGTRRLACGSLHGRRVRVVETVRPYLTLFEANANDNPWVPDGGVWSVERVTFLCQGKYLLAEYRFGGRSTAPPMYPTDIFATDTWSRVWHENSLAIRSVTLSPDGKKIAFLRQCRVEIGDFLPADVSRSSDGACPPQ
jgi:hypothetical protein